MRMTDVSQDGRVLTVQLAHEDREHGASLWPRPASLSRPTDFEYCLCMTSFLHPRPLRRLAACLTLSASVLWADRAAAQGSPLTGFTSLPSFAWPQPAGTEESRWASSYARMSTDFEVSSSKHFGSYAGPTVGFEGGRQRDKDSGERRCSMAGGAPRASVTRFYDRA